MNIDLSRQDLELIIRRFAESEQQDIDEQLLANRLRMFLQKPDANPAKKYQQDFKYETPVPPAPAADTPATTSGT